MKIKIFFNNNNNNSYLRIAYELSSIPTEKSTTQD